MRRAQDECIQIVTHKLQIHCIQILDIDIIMESWKLLRAMAQYLLFLANTGRGIKNYIHLAGLTNTS